MNPHETLGLAIRTERKRHSLNQEQLAQLAGCGLTFIHQLEAGKPTVRLDKCLSVLSVLGLSITLTKGKGLLTVEVP